MKKRRRLIFVIIFFSITLLTRDASIPLDFLQDAQIPEPTLIHTCTMHSDSGWQDLSKQYCWSTASFHSTPAQIDSSQFEQNELSHAGIVCDDCYTLFYLLLSILQDLLIMW